MARDTQGLSVKKADDLSAWYTEVVQKAELADYAPVKGFMVVRPRAMVMWEEIQDWFNAVLKKKEVQNAYFPTLIPESFFKKEAEHAEGFAPELLFVDTKGSKDILDAQHSENVEGADGLGEGERLALRPTSETIMYDSYAKWIRSWRDLPLKMNQWCNVFRWEVKQTKPFLRTREFLWQEGHCAFADEEGAAEDMESMASEYLRLCESLLAIPVLVGRKSQAEKFPGAKTTMTLEALMPDGKALQMGTSHNLGQGFARSFDVQFEDQEKHKQHVWQTSWGVSTRMIGAVCMVHGDDNGLVIPPRLAREKVVVVPIVFKGQGDEVLKAARAVGKKLAKFGAFVDDRLEYSPGWKFHEWEMKGVPLRVEIGPKDIEKKQVVLVRRDTGAKKDVKVKDLVQRIGEALEDMQSEMFKKAKEFLESRMDSAKTLSELVKKVEQGKIVRVFMKDDVEVEGVVKDATGGAVSRIVEDVSEQGKCVGCGEVVSTQALVARNY